MLKFFSRESHSDLLLLLLIVVTGTVLRFWNFSHCPYTHDEISSLERAHYGSFSELIEKGVKPDTHPPLLQVFLQYYTQTFGSSEMMVKFPFILCGIISIVLVYLIASKWFGSSAGLMSAAVVSTVQYTVMYSVIARHYSLGLFLTLLLVYFQQKYFEQGGRNKIRWLLAFSATGIASAYTHYFCLLFTAVVALTGFLNVSKKNALYYFIACAVIPLSFIPYLPVFFIQFGYNGIGGPEGWLGTPDSSFFLQYFRYIFHYSDFYLLLILGVTAVGLVGSIIRKEKIISPHRLICLAWFVIPLLTGYFYSVKVNPILQYSILIFSFPYLLMILFSFLSKSGVVLKTTLVTMILVLSTFTLIYGRKHFDLFYNQGISKIIDEINSVKQQFGKDSVEVVVNVEDYFLNYYRSKYPDVPAERFLSINTISDITAFRKIVSASDKKYFLFATIRVYPLECIGVLKEIFPASVSKYRGHLTEIFLRSKSSSALNEEIIFKSENNFALKPAGWNFPEQKVFPDSLTAKKYFQYEQADEFGVEFQVPLRDLIKSEQNILYATANAVISDSGSYPMLVMTMERNGKSLDWRSSKFSDYMKPGKAGNVFLAVRFADIGIDTKDVRLKVYTWNKGHAAFRINSISVSSEIGNPYFYGLFEEF